MTLKRTMMLFVLFSLFHSLYSFVLRKSDYAKGPLYGKNMFSQYILYHQIPGINAGIGGRFELSYHFSFYISQDFLTKKILIQDLFQDKQYHEHQKYVVMDYESLVYELGAAFHVTKKLALGLDLRLISYYGGFTDSLVENFHHAFGFPNAGREYFRQNQIFINIKTNQNFTIYLDHPVTGFGDIDLWIKYNLLHRSWLDLAVYGGFKIPSGQLKTVTGSGFPDQAVAFLIDFKPVWFMTLYFHQGLVIPMNVIPFHQIRSYPMFNGLMGIEFHPVKFFSLILQMNIKTPPFNGTHEFVNNLNMAVEFFSQPQTNLLVGLIFKVKKFRFQLYFEEDTFTNAGVDWTLNMMFSHSLRVEY